MTTPFTIIITNTLPAVVTAILLVTTLKPSQVTSTPVEPAALTVEELKVNVLTLTQLALSVRTAVNPPSDSLSPALKEEVKLATAPVTDILHTKVPPVLLLTHILGWSSLGHSCCRLSHSSVITDIATDV